MEENIEITDHVVLENEGKRLFGIFHRPLNAKKFPAILICHGLAGNKTGRYRLYVDLARALAKEGIGVLRIDFRGAGDSDGAFADTRVKGMISDAKVALDHLHHIEGVDASRVGVFGKSFGGAIAVLASELAKNIRSIALWAPFFSGKPWIEIWEKAKNSTVSDEVRKQLMSFNGQMGSVEFFEEFFNIELSNTLESLHNTPILHIHGAKDMLVDSFHSEAYQKIRQNALAKNVFMMLPNSDHDFTDLMERNFALQTTVSWFKETL